MADEAVHGKMPALKSQELGHGSQVNRRATEVGPRISDYSSTVFDYRLGFRGKITDSIDWDLSGSYGESEKLQTIKGYTLQSRWRQGALVNGTLANPVCQDTSNGCVPVNLFGADGSITPAMADFLSENSSTKVRTALTQVRGIVSGDLGFALPSASEPYNFALGAEYRAYKAEQASDLLAKTPGELGGAGVDGDHCRHARPDRRRDRPVRPGRAARRRALAWGASRGASRRSSRRPRSSPAPPGARASPAYA